MAPVPAPHPRGVYQQCASVPASIRVAPSQLWGTTGEHDITARMQIGNSLLGFFDE